jgi:peptidoglycan LD-endopeptidase LytH
LRVRSKYFILFVLLLIFSSVTPAEATTKDITTQERMPFYLKAAALTDVPWYLLAAIDQFERNVRTSRRDLPDPDGPIAILVPKNKWLGPLNPSTNNRDPLFISLFNGMGKDGNGDGAALENDPDDELYSMATYLNTYGSDWDDYRAALWDYYHRDKTVQIISEIARLYKHFGTIDLDERSFPIPLRYNYDYRSTWGASRGWGGRRIHEGTDIFADYSTPVKATSYGIIEMMGWNKFGGWRLGIRDTKNVYHYYGHLSGYAKGIKKGSIVKPGEIIGSVGSSGYGPKGTQGKFPPHLHYGMYKYNGNTEFSFDPYPYLRVWERDARRKK